MEVIRRRSILARPVLALLIAFLARTAHALSQTTMPTSAAAPSHKLAEDPRMIRWSQTFFWSMVLLIVFMIAAGVIIRFSLRFRSYLLHDRSAATPSDDVWAMHRFPEKFEFNDDKGEEGGEKSN